MQILTQNPKNILTVALVATLSVHTPAARAAEKNTSAKSARAELPQLQVTVDVPPNWRPFLSDDLAEAFASHLTEVFHRRGYTGKIHFLDHEDPLAGVPVLAVRLINWRIGHADSAECNFTASLTAAGQEQDLGIFEHTNLILNQNQGRRGFADALGEVADGALGNLSAKVAQAGLLRGFSAAKV
jgi:hypothetical protein